jgi:hypothetical protein
VETTTIEIALVGDAILGRRPLPDALTWHCATSLQTNDTGREERKFHCGLHKAIQGARRLAVRLDERRHQCALLDLSQTIPHCGFAYLSRTARPTKDEDRGSAPANSSPHDNALRRQCTIELLRSKSGPPHNPPRRLDCGFGARTTIARASSLQRPAPPNVSAVSPGHRPTFVGDCSGFQRIIWDNVSSDVFVSVWSRSVVSFMALTHFFGLCR